MGQNWLCPPTLASYLKYHQNISPQNYPTTCFFSLPWHDFSSSFLSKKLAGLKMIPILFSGMHPRIYIYNIAVVGIFSCEKVLVMFWGQKQTVRRLWCARGGSAAAHARWGVPRLRQSKLRPNCSSPRAPYSPPYCSHVIFSPHGPIPPFVSEAWVCVSVLVA